MEKISTANLVWMAWRNFSASRRGSSGISFMTIMSVLGVAIGVAALIIVLSVMGGFEGDLKRKMLAGLPHIEILGENAVAGFSLKEHPIEEMRKLFPESTAIEPFTQADVVIKRRNFLQSANLFGVDPQNQATIWGFHKETFVDGALEDLEKFRAPLREDQQPGDTKLPVIALGDQLAHQLQADIGDEIIVLSPQASASTVMSGATLSQRFVLGATFSTGLFTYDTKWAVVHIREGRKFLPEYDESLTTDEFVTGLGLNVSDPLNAEKLITRIPESSGLKATTWKTSNKSLLFALKLEKFAMGSVLMLIVIVAAFSISGTMMMMVYFKRGQVSLLRALGMSQRDVGKLFLIHSFTIGSVGIVMGLMLGLAGIFFIDKVKSVPLPAGVYYLKVMPVVYLPTDYVVICAAAWVFSLLAGCYPALLAARQNPSEGLRYE